MPNQTLKQSHNAHTHNDTISTEVFGIYGEVGAKLEAPRMPSRDRRLVFGRVSLQKNGRRFQRKELQ